MKKEMILPLSIGIVVGGLLVFIGGKIFSASSGSKGNPVSSVSLALPEVDELTDAYLVKVENHGITVEDFTNAYELLQKNLPAQQKEAILSNEPAAKAEILENMINQYAVVATAIEEGFLEDPKIQKQFRNAAQQALLQLYISENMPSDENAFAASKPEIEQAYAQHRQQIAASGMNATQAQEYLSGQISQQKQQRWMYEFISKVKEGFRVERNNEAIKNNGISTTRTPFAQPQPVQ